MCFRTRRVFTHITNHNYQLIAGGLRSNCYKFIQWVTAAGYSTISHVEKQMKTTGGDREPPEHGLRKYHRELQKKQAQKEAEHHNESDQREVKDDHVDHLTGEVLYQVPQPISGRHEREVFEPYSTYFLRFRFSSSCNRTTHISK